MARMTVKLAAVLFIFLLLGACAEVKQNVMGEVVGKVVMDKADRAYERKDYAAALANYRRAAEYGNAQAQYFLADMLMRGQGTRKNRSEALKWMHKSADGGFAPAQVALGLRYQFGHGVPKDMVRAHALFLKAAESGNADGQYFVAVLSAIGLGTTKDRQAALRWFRLAKSNGFPVPAELLTIEGVSALGSSTWRTPRSSSQAAALQGPSLVRKIQQSLKQLGYDPGPVDGIYGKKTRAAIEAFQRQSGLGVDGKATPALLETIEAQK